MKERNVYRKVYLRLWRHEKFKMLTSEEKVLALYLVSGPQTNLIGWYRFSPAMASEDIGASLPLVKKRLETICQLFDWQYDEASQLLWIKSWHRWNPPNGLNATKAWQREISVMPSGEIQQRLTDAISGNGALSKQ